MDAIETQFDSFHQKDEFLGKNQSDRSVAELDRGTTHEDEENDQPSTTTQKKRAFNTATKLEIVSFAKSISNHAAAKQFNVGRSTIRAWRQQEAKLKELNGNRKRLDGGGRHLTSREVDDALALWIMNKELNDNKELSRHNFSLRVATTVCQKPPTEYENTIVKYILYLKNLREENAYKFIFACDETGVWPDAPGGKCVNERGAREVGVLSTGHEKLRITVMLSGRPDGKKLRPFVLLPKPPSMDIYLTWIADAWNKIPEEMISQSFKTCGIMIAADGSEDHLIHCFKPDGSIPTGYQKLKDARLDKEIVDLLEGMNTN